MGQAGSLSYHGREGPVERFDPMTPLHYPGR
jgi:hypothetical protein